MSKEPCLSLYTGHLTKRIWKGLPLLAFPSELDSRFNFGLLLLVLVLAVVDLLSKLDIVFVYNWPPLLRLDFYFLLLKN